MTPDHSTRVFRQIATPIRSDADWEERWKSSDQGLIACWERGREKAEEDPNLAARAKAYELPALPWKGGIDPKKRIPKHKKKSGAMEYLAMWQGLRGDDLSIDRATEYLHVCSATQVEVTFTTDRAKLNEPEADDQADDHELHRAGR